MAGVADAIPGFPDRFPLRRDGRRPWRYRIAAGFCRLSLRTLFVRRLTIEGIADVPMEGPLLVVCNHISNWDPMLVGGFFPGTLFALAKRELFRPALMAWVLAGCNCVPIDRGRPDRRALRTCLELLRGGGRLLVFIEGTRSHQAGMRAVEAGAGFLVRRTGTPVLPVAVWGTERGLHRSSGWLPRRGHVHMRCGPPVIVRGTTDQQIADAIAEQIASLLPRRYRGVHSAALESRRPLDPMPASAERPTPQRGSAGPEVAVGDHGGPERR